MEKFPSLETFYTHAVGDVADKYEVCVPSKDSKNKMDGEIYSGDRTPIDRLEPSSVAIAGHRNDSDRMHARPTLMVTLKENWPVHQSWSVKNFLCRVVIFCTATYETTHFLASQDAP